MACRTAGAAAPRSAIRPGVAQGSQAGPAVHPFVVGRHAGYRTTRRISGPTVNPWTTIENTTIT